MDAFQRHGLYYPFFHVRDDRWLKVSALYWPRVARLVPDWYLTTRDSETAQAFSNADPDFLYRLSPGDAVEEVGARFAQALEVCGSELRQRTNPRLWQPVAGGVHVIHISPALRDQLVEMGLAFFPIPTSRWEAFRERVEWEEAHPGLPYLHADYEVVPIHSHSVSEWVAMPRELVVVYNSMLVEHVAAVNQLQPTTDLPGAFTVLNDWSADQIAAVLLGRPVPPRPGPARKMAQTLAFLAIDAVVPANLDRIPAEKIIEIRERYGAEFQAFGLAVDQAAADLAQLADVRDPAVIDRYLSDEVASRFTRPAKDLRRQLSGLKLEAATMTINVKTDLPAAAGLIGGATMAGHPLIAGAAAVALGLLAVRRGIRRQRDSSLETSPAASYLIHLGENLGPRSMVTEAAHRFQQIAGTDVG